MINVVSSSDGVVVSGGGNLSATWPEQVYERAALGEMAHRFGKPLVFLGQTIGPDLSPALEPLLARLLQRAEVVGVRELPSAAMALALGVSPKRLLYQTDDALELAPTPIEDAWAEPLRRGGSPWIAVTIDPFAVGEEAVAALDALASQLSQLATYAQARLVFIPHVAAPDGKGDVAVGRELAARLSAATPMSICDVLEARQARWLTGQSDLVVSTRYHPLVFGLAAGTPGIGIVTDEYRRLKLQGALAHAGLGRYCLPLQHAVQGGLFDAASALWGSRDDIARQLAVINETHRIDEKRRWRKIFAALGLSDRSDPPRNDVTAETANLVLDADPQTLVWRLLDELDARRRFAVTERSPEALRQRELERYLGSLESERVALRAAAQESEHYAQSLLEEHAKLQAMRGVGALRRTRWRPSCTRSVTSARRSRAMRGL